MAINSKDELRVNSLLREYSELRCEIRTFEILAIVCIFIAVLLFVALLITASLSNQYILLFVAPGFSMFFAIVAMAIFSYIINLELRASQIEGQLRQIVGEPTINWESTVGVFASITGDILNIQVGRYWFKFAVLGLVVGIVPIVFSLWYGFEGFYDKVGNIIWFVIGFYIAVALVTTFVAYRFWTRDWEKLKLSL